jgi:hypothetical protein
MDTPRRNSLDTEAILNDLYASEINASISWIWDGGFYVTVRDPKQAEVGPSRASARLSSGCGIRPSAITKMLVAERAERVEFQAPTI